MDFEVLGKFRPVCHTKYGLLTYRREHLYLLKTETGEMSHVCPLPMEDPRKPFCFSDFTTRLMHISVYCGMEVPGGAVVVFNRGIYFADLECKTAIREHTFHLPDMRQPLNIYRIQGVPGFADCIVYGDYSYNASHKAVHIWKRSESGQWDSCYHFPENSIRHIHSIIPDPYRGRVIICTGDYGEEVGVWAAYEDFSRVERIFGGDQLYRVCCARAYPEGIMMVTDSPFDQNYVYMLAEENGRVKVEPIFEVPGPTVFFTNYGDQVAFSTDVEFDARVLKGLRRQASYRRGPGVQDWYSHLFLGNPARGFREILRLRKDIWPMGALGFGKIHFPNGECPNKLYFYPTAIRRVDGRMCCMEIPCDENSNACQKGSTP